MIITLIWRVNNMSEYSSSKKKQMEKYNAAKGKWNKVDDVKKGSRGSSKKNVKVPGKKTTITIQGPSTYKSDLKGGALDEFVAPKVAKAKKKMGEIKQSARNIAGKVASKVDSFKSKANN